MSIDGIGTLLTVNPYKTDLFSISREKEKKFSPSDLTQNDPAKIAASDNVPTGISIGTNATAGSLWQAQDYAQSAESQAIDVFEAEREEKTVARDSTTAEKFLDYMDKTPEQLMREEILKSLGYTEEELAAMDPKERAKVEAKIKELTETKIEESIRKEITGENETATLT